MLPKFVAHRLRVFLVAGEASGDARGTELMRALRKRHPEIEFSGAGGPQMQLLAHGEFLDWAGEAVVGLWDVLRKYGYFRARFYEMLRQIERLRPAAVVLIDYPGFNLRLAKALRRTIPASQIIFYISPQVWAWNRARIPKMAKYLDLMLCIFPFEPELYLASGLKAVFVGHPMLDSLAPMKSAEHPREAKVIGLFPGSRTKEIGRILPVMIEVARNLHNHDATMRFEVAAASETAAEHIRKQIEVAGASEWRPAIVHDAHRLMQRAAVGLVASGTATLEAAFFEMPMVVIYKVAWLTWIVGKQLVRVPFLAMPNILAGRAIVPEFLQNAAQPERIARETSRLLHDPCARAEMQRALAGVIGQLGDRGAADRAAAAISAALNERSPA